MKIVCISDIHGRWNKVQIPECDLLISAGDYSWEGESAMVREYHSWLDRQPARYVLSVQGNHEKWVEKNFEQAKSVATEACPRVIFIDEGLVNVEGVSIWCSAITPYFCNWAWNRYPGEDIQIHWDRIPEGVDIIITHGPVYGILDSVPEFNHALGGITNRRCGCPQLLKRVFEVKPKLHVCGHIHEGSGSMVKDGISFINASICNSSYRAVNQPYIYNLIKDQSAA